MIDPFSCPQCGATLKLRPLYGHWFLDCPNATDGRHTAPVTWTSNNTSVTQPTTAFPQKSGE